MSAALTWLAASGQVPHWLMCLGALCTFVVAVVIVAAAYMEFESWRWRKDDR